MWETVLVTVGIVALSIILLAIKIILVKGGKFPDTHISGNQAMKERGIGCAKSLDREAQQRRSLFDRIDE